MEGVTRMLFCSIALFFTSCCPSAAVDTITTNKRLRDSEAIVSENGFFKMGFFSLGESKNRYLGVWYTKSPDTVAWVANRETPLTNTSGMYGVNTHGDLLILLNGTNSIIWSSNSSVYSRDINPVVQLLGTGNLVIRSKSDTYEENFIWQSFNYSQNTFLPGMKLGKNFVSGEEKYMSSWRSGDDPSQGRVRCHHDGDHSNNSWKEDPRTAGV